MKEESKHRISRRSFIKGVGGTAVTAAVLPGVPPKTAAAQEPMPQGVRVGTITLNVNGQPMTVSRVEPRTTLLDVLRNRLELTGTKPVCQRASCGACTVLMDGKAVYACSILAMDAEGAEIVTVEGLASHDKLHPIQEAFVEHDALQCGFCTPGFIMSIAGFLHQNPSPSQDEVKRAVSGNLCRCGTYTRIFEAVETAAQRIREGG